MKQWVIGLGIIGCLTVAPTQKAEAQTAILEVIKAAVKKVIVAVDLKVQRLQNRTIWLQNAQKTLENQMSKLKLTEIRDWVEKQRKLYDDYFEELRKVKTALTYYGKVKDIIERQVALINQYKSAWALFRQDKNFTNEELEYMDNTYAGIMDESLKGIDQLFLVVNAFATQMTDARRLEIINTVSDGIEQQITDMREFNNQNKMLSIQRAAERGEIEYVRRLYGLSR